MLGNFRQAKGWVVCIEGLFGALNSLFSYLWFDSRGLWMGNYITGLKLQIVRVFGAVVLHF